MLIQLDFGSNIPIYVQLRNQIVTGIGRGELKEGERLPTVRQLAQDAGVNTMTVNKTYQLLKAEGFITVDRRRGTTVAPVQQWNERYREKLTAELELLSAEARMKGMAQEDFLALCRQIFAGMQPEAERE
ncbi:MAG: GntR family transcriptional regulator [bacterium]|nr:GntR family transcriptional regulator [bacterium]MCM1376185.1 GntR family transcriptional regulator [Muribaculum sp.]